MAPRGSEEYKRACARRAAEHRARHPDRVKEIAAKSNRKHRAKKTANQKDDRKKNPEKYAEYRRRHYVKHQAALIEKAKNERENRTPERRLEKAELKRLWDAKNADHNREYRILNKHEIAMKAKRWYNANREHTYAVACAWRETNRDRVNLCASKNRRVNVTKYREVQRRYRVSHPDAGRIAKQVRRARKLNATVGDTKEIAAWEKQWRSRKVNTCHWCKRKCRTKDCHADHVVALSRGGEHSLSNLVVSCAKCNQKKNCKPPEVFNKQLDQPLLFI